MTSRKQHVPAKRLLLLILQVIFLGGTLAVNILAQALPLNGLRTDQISDLYPNLFVPSGRTFSIWAVIYTLLLLNLLYQAAVVKNEKRGEIIEETGVLFLLVHLGNSLWMLSWHFLYRYLTTSLIVMLLLLIALIFLYRKIQDVGEHLSERMFVLFPVSVYLGWILTATLANATALFTTIGPEWYSEYQVQITIVTILTAALTYSIITLSQKDVWIAAVGIWSIYGIFTRQRAEALYPSVILSSLIALALMALSVLITLLVKSRNSSDEDELL